jgi:hypothetical protein
MAKRVVGLSVALFLTAVVPGLAHHAFSAEFDANKPVVLKGTVSKLEWINPHGWIHIGVKGARGKVETWAIEVGAPNALLRRGLRKTDLPIGIEVTVKGFRAKDGSRKANGRSVTTADGRNYFTGSSGGDQPKDAPVPAGTKK